MNIIIIIIIIIIILIPAREIGSQTDIYMNQIFDDTLTTTAEPVDSEDSQAVSNLVSITRVDPADMDPQMAMYDHTYWEGIWGGTSLTLAITHSVPFKDIQEYTNIYQLRTLQLLLSSNQFSI